MAGAAVWDGVARPWRRKASFRTDVCTPHGTPQHAGCSMAGAAVWDGVAAAPGGGKLDLVILEFGLVNLIGVVGVFMNSSCLGGSGRFQ